MEGCEVGEDVFPAAVVVYGAGWVEGSVRCKSALLIFHRRLFGIIILRLIIEATNVVSVVRVVAKLAVAPALVHQSPRDYTRVIDISFEAFRPFLIETSSHLTIILIAAGHLSPHEEA